jgi:hypothetical protein
MGFVPFIFGMEESDCWCIFAARAAENDSLAQLVRATDS